jgi:hypothetical protein
LKTGHNAELAVALLEEFARKTDCIRRSPSLGHLVDQATDVGRCLIACSMGGSEELRRNLPYRRAANFWRTGLRLCRRDPT